MIERERRLADAMISDMEKRRPFALFIAPLLVLIFCVYVVWSDSDSGISGYVFGRLWATLLLAIAFIGSFVGLLFLISRFVPQDEAPNRAARWEVVRRQGKASYISKFAFFFSAPLILGIFFSFFYSGSLEPDDETLLISVGVIVLVLILLMIVVAQRNWDENERDYREIRVEHVDPHSDTGDSRSADG